MRLVRTLEAQVRLDLEADAAGPHALRERMELVDAQRHAPVRHWHRVAVHCSAHSTLISDVEEVFQGQVRHQAHLCKGTYRNAATSSVTD